MLRKRKAAVIFIGNNYFNCCEKKHINESRIHITAMSFRLMNKKNLLRYEALVDEQKKLCWVMEHFF